MSQTGEIHVIAKDVHVIREKEIAPLGRVVTLPPFYPDATPKHLFFIDLVDRHMAVDETRISIGMSAVEPSLVAKIFFVCTGEDMNIRAINALNAR